MKETHQNVNGYVIHVHGQYLVV